MAANLLDTEAAATYLGLRPNTLAKARCRGDGPRFVRLGGKGSIRYRLEDLNAWLVDANSTSEVAA
jgi:predicted DNA-binding transcriptional regulator AlpA